MAALHACNIINSMVMYTSRRAMWRRNCLANAGALRLSKEEDRVIVGRREWEAAHQLWWLLLYVDLLWLAFFLW
jgi:hypothetical protein